MWHKAESMGRLVKLELTCEGLLVRFANHYTTRYVLATEKSIHWIETAFAFKSQPLAKFFN